MPDTERWIQPTRGRFLAWLINLILRLTVKRHLHGCVDALHMRKRQAAFNARLGGRRSKALTQDVDCDGVPAQWLRPTNAKPDRILLHLHGGAFVARSPALHADLVTPWCEALQATALLPQYRLAPEHRYPAGLDDCVTTYLWLVKQGYRADQIVLSGDSAGGNLSLALLQALKARGLELPRCVVLLSPFVDFTLNGNSLASEAKRDPMFTPEFVISLRKHYLDPSEVLQPTASPLFGDLSDLPPMLIQAGELEMLRDESVRMAEAIKSQNGEVTLQIWAGLPHVFQAFTLLPQAAQASQQIIAFIARQTGWSELSK